MTRPAVRVDNWVIFPDGRTRRLSIWERWRGWRGKLSTVKVKNAKHGPYVGE